MCTRILSIVWNIQKKPKVCVSVKNTADMAKIPVFGKYFNSLPKSMEEQVDFFDDIM